MLLAGILFDIGVVLTAGALNIYMLMAGRVLLGVAVAFASVSVTLYNSEMAPAQLRGRLNQLFQVAHPAETLTLFHLHLFSCSLLRRQLVKAVRGGCSIYFSLLCNLRELSCLPIRSKRAHALCRSY